MEGRSAPLLRLHPDAPAVGLDNGAADRQAQPHALSLGRGERAEDLIDHAGVDAGTRVRHGDADEAGFGAATGYDEMPQRRIGHRLHGVANQIDQHLFDLDAVGQHGRGLRVQVKPNSHAPVARIHQAEIAGRSDQDRQILDRLLDLAPGDEVAQPAHDLSRAQSLKHGVVESFPNIGNIGLFEIVDQITHALCVVDHRRQRLSQLMGQCRRHGAHGAHSRHMDQLRL